MDHQGLLAFEAAAGDCLIQSCWLHLALPSPQESSSVCLPPSLHNSNQNTYNFGLLPTGGYKLGQTFQTKIRARWFLGGRRGAGRVGGGGFAEPLLTGGARAAWAVYVQGGYRGNIYPTF